MAGLPLYGRQVFGICGAGFSLPAMDRTGGLREPALHSNEPRRWIPRPAELEGAMLTKIQEVLAEPRRDRLDTTVAEGPLEVLLGRRAGPAERRAAVRELLRRDGSFSSAERMAKRFYQMQVEE